MHFETIKHRRVTIKQLTTRQELREEINEYLRQLQSYPVMEEDKIAINRNIADEIYLSIYSESNKFIGIIKLTASNDEKIAYLEISIPNSAWSMRYGTEALHQTIKRCKEMSEMRVTLNKENSIVLRYKEERPNIFWGDTFEINFKNV